MTKRIGSPVYATEQGLGRLARAFYEHDVFDAPFVVQHAHHVNHPEWYPAGTPRVGVRDVAQPQARRDLENWVRSLDLLLCFETPFDYYLVHYARSVGVPTALMTMHECTPATFPNRFDHLLCPSLLDLEAFAHPSVKMADDFNTFEAWPDSSGMNAAYYTPVPVDTDLVPWRAREKCDVLVHNAGWGGLAGRNGTREFLHALDLMEARPGVVLRTQKDEADIRTMVEYLRGKGWDVQHLVGTANYEDLFTEGDVFVFPEKFNGLSLPLQEAFAAGMMVVTTDRFPNNTYIPPDGLFPPGGSKRSRVGPAYREFDEAVINPRHLAERLDGLAGAPVPEEYTRAAAEYRETMSWDNLGGRWTDFVASLCK